MLWIEEEIHDPSSPSKKMLRQGTALGTMNEGLDGGHLIKDLAFREFCSKLICKLQTLERFHPCTSSSVAKQADSHSSPHFWLVSVPRLCLPKIS
jgi:hypothetical protein